MTHKPKNKKEMMKFKLNILALALFGFGLASCTNSFLDVESKTESSTGNYYKTESDAYRALVGCYDGWQCTTSNKGVGFYLASEMMSDECFGATGVADGRNYQVIDRFDQAQSTSDLNIYETDWKNYYAAVYRCNELISRADDINWTSEATRGTYIGEARAIRALCYFDMVRLWENIPLLDIPTTDNISQANPDDVYQLIISDLKYAAENIPANAYPKAQAASNDGHITKYAAEALLARVYLFYSGYSASGYSFAYTNDMNGDGINNDMMYIPKDDSEIKFKNEADRTAFWNFVDQDSYLKNHKGEYAEAYAARAPWVHRFDLRITEDFSFKAGKTEHHFQLSLDFMNIGNMINSKWGVMKNASSSNGCRILKYEGMDDNKTPIFSMYKINGEYPTETYSYNRIYTECWKMQVGIRYIFN